MSKLKDISTEKLLQQQRAVERMLAVQEAQTDFLRFAQFMMPDPEDINDPNKTQYEITPQAKLLAEVLQKVERGELLRVAVSIGPQLGKSQLISRFFPAWCAGKHPYKHMMLGAYNQDFANEFGGEVRTILESIPFKQVFPKYNLRKGFQSKDLMISGAGGKMAFVGVGGSGSGKPADIFIIDDPIKNDEDAQSPAFREKLWNWFNRVATARCHKFTAIVIVHTRWHEDDLIGRLCDPNHPERNGKYAGIADDWTYINLPAVVQEESLAKALGLTLKTENDEIIKQQFGDKPIAALWENRKPVKFLANIRRMDPRGFDALYMGKPSPDSGDYFKKEWLIEHYKPEDYPSDRELNFYAASDHALSTKEDADKTCMGVFGVDSDDDIWIMPDLVWDRLDDTDEMVNEMLRLMRVYKPGVWFAEDEHINKSIGPFRRRRMMEEKIYTVIQALTSTKDLKSRARPIQGRLAMGKVHFPAWAPWWQDAKAELLGFPYKAKDDFVSFMSLIGRGMESEWGMSKSYGGKSNILRSGSLEWILAQSRLRARKEAEAAEEKGW